jgi:hypothetical protein
MPTTNHLKAEHRRASAMSNDKAQALTAQITNSIKALCAETDAAKQSAVYQNWLSALSRFHQYSYGNCLLIWAQATEATRVAGFHTWKSLGRNVKKGEKSIRILAPIVRKLDEEVNGKLETVSRPIGWRCVSVFDRLSRDLRPARFLPRVPCGSGGLLDGNSWTQLHHRLVSERTARR